MVYRAGKATRLITTLRPGEGKNDAQGPPEDTPHVGGRRGAHAGSDDRPQPLVLRRACRARGGPELWTNRASGACAGSVGTRPSATVGGNYPARLRSLALGFPIRLPLCPSEPSSPLALGARLAPFNPCPVRGLARLEPAGPRSERLLTGRTRRGASECARHGDLLARGLVRQVDGDGRWPPGIGAGWGRQCIELA